MAYFLSMIKKKLNGMGINKNLIRINSCQKQLIDLKYITLSYDVYNT